MSETLQARKVQTLTKNEYMPATWCDCFTCSAGSKVPDCNTTDDILDWTADWQTCCGGLCVSQRKCVFPDKDECKLGPSSRGLEPLSKIQWDKTAPNVVCTYELENVDTIAQLENYKNKFGDANYDKLLAAYCERPTTNCPEGLKSCSIIKSLSEGGNACRDWFAKLPTNELRDAAAQNYCFKYDTDDCKCVNRSLTEEYKNLKQGNPFSDKCWFVPCANPSRYFVPSILEKDECPDNVCEVIFNVYKDRDVSIYDNDIVCNFDKGGGSALQWIKDHWPFLALAGLLILMVAMVVY